MTCCRLVVRPDIRLTQHLCTPASFRKVYFFSIRFSLEFREETWINIIYKEFVRKIILQFISARIFFPCYFGNPAAAAERDEWKMAKSGFTSSPLSKSHDQFAREIVKSATSGNLRFFAIHRCARFHASFCKCKRNVEFLICSTLSPNRKHQTICCRCVILFSDILFRSRLELLFRVIDSKSFGLPVRQAVNGKKAINAHNIERAGNHQLFKLFLKKVDGLFSKCRMFRGIRWNSKVNRWWDWISCFHDFSNFHAVMMVVTCDSRSSHISYDAPNLNSEVSIFRALQCKYLWISIFNMENLN